MPQQSLVSGAANSQLHPLLHENTSTSFDTQFTSRFDGSEFFFAEHQIQGQKVLPGSAHLEMARAALAKALALEADEVIELSDITWLRPVVMTDGEPLTVHISVNPLNDNQAEFDIYSVAEDGEETVYSQGRAEVFEPEAAQTVDIAALKVSCNDKTYDAQAVYDMFDQIGFAYGPAHRGIELLNIGDGPQVLAQLACNDERLNDYTMHPGLLDSVLQSALGIALTNGGAGPALPFALGALRLYQPLPAKLYVWLRFSEGSQPVDAVQKLDIVVCDEAGNVCAELERFSARAVAAQPQEVAEPTPQVEEKTIQALLPMWESADKAATTLEPKHFGNTVIVTADGDTELAAQQLVVELPGAKHISLSDCADETRFNAALGESADDIEQLIWVLPQDTTDSVSSDALISAQQQGVMGGLHMVQTLLAKGYMSRDLQLGVISWQTQAVSQVPHYPAHASVHGFIGSVAKECPRWKVKLLDVPLTADTALLKDSLNLVGAGSGEPLAYRRGQWYQQHLVPAQLPDLEESVVYRDNGVYVVIGGAGGLGEVWTETLIKQHQAQVVWLGRRELNADIQAKIDRLAAQGPAPVYIQADATDRDSMSAARQTINERFGAIHGVVHSAIVLSDKTLKNMETERFSKALGAKVDTCVRLAQVFADEPLDFVLFFSSLQSFAKNPGQSNYAAGCTFEDAFALRLAEVLSAPVKIINWGYWGSVGIVSDPAYHERMAQQGIGSIEPEEGMLLLEQLLNTPVSQLGAIK